MSPFAASGADGSHGGVGDKNRRTSEQEGENPNITDLKYDVSRSPRISMEGPIHRAVSDISAELSRKPPNSNPSPEVEKVQCECCGLSEECTPTYIWKVRELFFGRWICGLCAEAVKEERDRMGRGVSMEEALRAHIAVCVKFNKVARPNPALYMADAIRELLKKSCRNGLRTNHNSPRVREVGRTNIARSSSCIPAITRDPTSSS